MKIYTRSGDGGETGLFGGARVSKASARVASYGDVDELNSVLGLARSSPIDAERDALLEAIQSELFNLGAELASDPEKSGAKRARSAQIDDAEIAKLECAIDDAERELDPLKTFILPGGCVTAARLHHARTVCRRAERSVVGLGASEVVRPEIVRYLNRLSDLLFVLARLANAREEIEDVPWKSRVSDEAS